MHSQRMFIMPSLRLRVGAIGSAIRRASKRAQEAAMLLELAEELKARKGVLWGFGLNMWQIPGFHERTHMDQIRAAIEAAREG